MQTILIVIHVLLAIALIGMVLVQRGPGAAAGAAFGSGASSTVFGSRGAGSFLTRTTAVLGAGFFLISLTMAVMLSRGMFETQGPDLGVMGQMTGQEQADQQSAPVPEQSPPQGQETEADAVPAPPPGAESNTATDESGAVPEPPADGGG